MDYLHTVNRGHLAPVCHTTSYYFQFWTPSAPCHIGAILFVQGFLLRIVFSARVPL